MVSEEENIRTAKKIMKETLLPLMKKMKMGDWNIKLACKIGERNKDDEEQTAEVDTDNCEYKQADITLYKIRKCLKADLAHELFHCKIGLVVGAYKKAIDHYESMVSELITRDEERVVTDLEFLYAGLLGLDSTREEAKKK